MLICNKHSNHSQLIVSCLCLSHARNWGGGWERDHQQVWGRGAGLLMESSVGEHPNSSTPTQVLSGTTEDLGTSAVRPTGTWLTPYPTRGSRRTASWQWAWMTVALSVFSELLLERRPGENMSEKHVPQVTAVSGPYFGGVRWSIYL